MQKINLHNYEAFLLDYLEGNLNESDLQELKTFSVLNPELDIDFTSDELPTFNLANETFINKTALIKTEDDFILNNPSLNYVENNLTATEKISFENLLKTNSTLQREVVQLQKTKLSADTSVIYPNKKELKKQTKVIALFNFKTISAIAAGLLLVMSLSFVLYNYFNSNKKSEVKIALKSKSKNNFSSPKKQLNDTASATKNLIAKNTTNRFTTKQVKKNNVTTNSIKATYTINNSVVNAPIKKDSTLSTSTNTNSAIAIYTTALNPVLTNTTNTTTTQTTLLAYEEDIDESTQTNTVPQKNNLWKRAVKVAKQLNGLGLKAVKGDEKSTNDYVLAFNSVSIEKK